MGELIVIEGLDGSGKQTLARALRQRWSEQGRRVSSIAFPRYGESVHADLIRDGLYGRLGDLSDSVHGMALLFALDRRGAADEIRNALRDNDIVLLDRYISSNAAYGAARLGGPDSDAGREFPTWVAELEIERFGIPAPDRQLLLNTPVDVAAERAASRADKEADRSLDRFESDGGLQERTGRMYACLADDAFLSPWDRVSSELTDLPAGL